MTKHRQLHPLSARIRNEATEWLLRFSEGEVGAGDREEFYCWLRASPDHVRAYLRIAAFWQEAGHIGDQKAPADIAALIAQARQERNVLPLAFGSSPHERTTVAEASSSENRASVRSNPRARRLLGFAATLLIALGSVTAHHFLTRNVYQTTIGEQRSVNLPDGSTLVLNADSRVKVRYSQTDRTIDLEQGQALFKVAKNPARPFIVRIGDTSVRAVGTQFDVYRRLSGTTVTVVEGRVAVTAQEEAKATQPTGETAGIEPATLQEERPTTSVSPGFGAEKRSRTATAHLPAPVFLGAGEQVTIPKLDLPNTHVPTSAVAPELQVRPVRAEEATAWTHGLLIFDGAPLSEVIQEFNRQNSKPLVLQGTPELAQIKITGTFPANGAERITGFLRERFGVTAQVTKEHIALTQE